MCGELVSMLGWTGEHGLLSPWILAIVVIRGILLLRNNVAVLYLGRNLPRIRKMLVSRIGEADLVVCRWLGE